MVSHYHHWTGGNCTLMLRCRLSTWICLHNSDLFNAASTVWAQLAVGMIGITCRNSPPITMTFPLSIPVKSFSVLSTSSNVCLIPYNNIGCQNQLCLFRLCFMMKHVELLSCCWWVFENASEQYGHLLIAKLQSQKRPTMCQFPLNLRICVREEDGLQ